MKNKDRLNERIKFRNLPVGITFYTTIPRERYIKVGNDEILYMGNWRIYNYGWDNALENYVMVVNGWKIKIYQKEWKWGIYPQVGLCILKMKGDL